ncbi:hypothetical protein KSS87_009690 [Heliosperma pusillum]|nr:hypothetical protein KSS87_009690 [Heliosperma pusillum]
MVERQWLWRTAHAADGGSRKLRAQGRLARRRAWQMVARGRVRHVMDGGCAGVGRQGQRWRQGNVLGGSGSGGNPSRWWWCFKRMCKRWNRLIASSFFVHLYNNIGVLSSESFRPRPCPREVFCFPHVHDDDYKDIASSFDFVPSLRRKDIYYNNYPYGIPPTKVVKKILRNVELKGTYGGFVLLEATFQDDRDTPTYGIFYVCSPFNKRWTELPVLNAATGDSYVRVGFTCYYKAMKNNTRAWATPDSIKFTVVVFIKPKNLDLCNIYVYDLCSEIADWREYQCDWYFIMGFNSVYQTLVDVFPQVDIRLLKAVAIEHSKDPDEAVNHILVMVLPFIDGKSDDRTVVVETDEKIAETSDSSASTSGSIAADSVVPSSPRNNGHNPDDDSLASSFYNKNDDDDQLKGVQKSLLISPERYEDIGCEFGEDEGSSVPTQNSEIDLHANTIGDASSLSIRFEDGEADENLENVVTVQPTCMNSSSSYDLPPFDSFRDQPPTYCNSLDHKSEMDSTSNDQTHENVDVVGAENDILFSSIITRSGQICKVKLLEDIIEEAKNYKDTVYSAKESVARLMEEVELQKNEAEQAKIASTKGEIDILEKVEEIKKTLKHAKEANDMHIGEVYGEKSILATEVKELQARLLCLSAEKDKSLSTLDEMRKSLEERLAIAEEQRKEAEKELFDKQEIARGALAEQELIMEKVVQESKLLKQEAEENAKLSDFLMEKGEVVDELQGELSVISQDVKLLKDNFENRISHSKSLSSSNSSAKSTEGTGAEVRRKEREGYNTTRSMETIASLERAASLKSTASSGERQAPRSEFEGENLNYEAISPKLLSDEDWEVCDMI